MIIGRKKPPFRDKRQKQKRRKKKGGGEQRPGTEWKMGDGREVTEGCFQTALEVLREEKNKRKEGRRPAQGEETQSERS